MSHSLEHQRFTECQFVLDTELLTSLHSRGRSESGGFYSLHWTGSFLETGSVSAPRSGPGTKRNPEMLVKLKLSTNDAEQVG